MLIALIPSIRCFRGPAWNLSRAQTLRPLSVLSDSQLQAGNLARKSYYYHTRNLWISNRKQSMSTTTTTTSGVDTPTKIKIDVTSDSICPFCFIGKRKLDRAIEMAKEKGLNADFEVEFLPFLLDPTLKEDEPVSKKLRYEQKFGKERFDSMEAAMIERGKLNGINFSYGGNVRQTTDSHRLLTLAYEKGGQIMQADLVEKMFSGYFEQEQDIGDRDFLSTQAVAAGLFSSVEEARGWLATDAKKEEVQQGILKAQAMGISGVPFFVFNNKFAISGAEDSELFVQVFERILGEAGAPSKPVSTGQTC